MHFFFRFLKVHTMEKSKHSNREKRVDTSLSVTATEDLIKFKDSAGDNKAIIFFTGMHSITDFYGIISFSFMNEIAFFR